MAQRVGCRHVLSSVEMVPLVLRRLKMKKMRLWMADDRMSLRALEITDGFHMEMDGSKEYVRFLEFKSFNYATLVAICFPVG